MLNKSKKRAEHASVIDKVILRQRKGLGNEAFPEWNPQDVQHFAPQSRLRRPHLSLRCIEFISDRKTAVHGEENATAVRRLAEGKCFDKVSRLLSRWNSSVYSSV